MTKKRKAVDAVDFDELQTISNPADRNLRIGDSVSRANYVSISDCLANASRGGLVALEKLENTVNINMRNGSIMKWRIKCVSNENGSAAKPGDKIIWKRQLHNRKERGMGPKMGSVEQQDMIRRGDGDQILEMGEAILDDDCCFEAAYRDASYLLSQFGIYYLSGYPLTNKKKTNRSGVNNWRYIEVPPGWEDEKSVNVKDPEPTETKELVEDPKPWEASSEQKSEPSANYQNSSKRPYKRRGN